MSCLTVHLHDNVHTIKKKLLKSYNQKKISATWYFKHIYSRAFTHTHTFCLSWVKFVSSSSSRQTHTTHTHTLKRTLCVCVRVFVCIPDMCITHIYIYIHKTAWYFGRFFHGSDATFRHYSLAWARLYHTMYGMYVCTKL